VGARGRVHASGQWLLMESTCNAHLEEIPRVLTVRKIVVAVGNPASVSRAASYLLAVADSPEAFARGDNCLAGHDRRHASHTGVIWIGAPSTLALLGLESGAEVQADELAAVLRGRHPRSGCQVRALGTIEHGRSKQRVPGLVSLDLTFSAPKSVSVLWSQAPHEQRGEIEQAMLTSAAAMIEHMTQTKRVVYGRDADGARVRELASGVAAAAALHVTARRAQGEEVPSPQLHVHGLMVGVERRDGRLVAADSWELFKHGAPLEGGAVGRAVLADRLVGLGYDVEGGTGRLGRFFEVRGVPAGLMERMSGRTRDVKRAASELERVRGEKPRGGALSVLATQTRQTKDPAVSADQIARVWAAQGEEFGFGVLEALALRASRGYQAGLAERRAEARAAVTRRFAECGKVSLGAARAIVYEAAPGRLGLHDARGLLAEIEGSPSWPG
jgi:conjugative relaxase-like TrwC/TraI family protein